MNNKIVIAHRNFHEDRYFGYEFHVTVSCIVM